MYIILFFLVGYLSKFPSNLNFTLIRVINVQGLEAARLIEGSVEV